MGVDRVFLTGVTVHVSHRLFVPQDGVRLISLRFYPCWVSLLVVGVLHVPSCFLGDESGGTRYLGEVTNKGSFFESGRNSDLSVCKVCLLPFLVLSFLSIVDDSGASYSL